MLPLELDMMPMYHRLLSLAKVRSVLTAGLTGAAAAGEIVICTLLIHVCCPKQKFWDSLFLGPRTCIRNLSHFSFGRKANHVRSVLSTYSFMYICVGMQCLYTYNISVRDKVSYVMHH